MCEGEHVFEQQNSCVIATPFARSALEGKLGSFPSQTVGRPFSSAMALRLAKAFNTSAERWMAIQQQYDLWQARRSVNLRKVRQLVEGSAGR